jgi:phosphohistidine phosphatase
MELYLMRHGVAVDPNEWSKGDSTRPLSDAGLRQLDEAVPGMIRAGFRPKSILASPFIRAVQTADKMAALGSPKPRPVSELASGAKAEAYRHVLITTRPEAPVLIIGHLPDIALFAARVVSDPSLVESGMKPGEIVALESGPLEKKWGEGRILWRKRIEEWTP